MPRRNIIVFSDIFKSANYLYFLNKLALLNVNSAVIILETHPSPFSEEVLKLQNNRLVVKIVTSRLKLFCHLLVYFSMRPLGLMTSGWSAAIISIPTATILRVKNRRMVRHHGSLHESQAIPILGRYKGLFLDWLLHRLANTSIAVSKTHYQYLLSKNVKPQKLIYINNSYAEVAQLVPKSMPFSYSMSSREKPFKIGIISRFTEWKGIRFALQALSQIAATYENIEIILVGRDEGDELESIREIIDCSPQFKLRRVTFMENIEFLYNELHCVVHVPINKYCESFGQVLVESLYARVPLIATKTGFLASDEVLCESVYLVDFKSSESIVLALTELLNSDTPRVIDRNHHLHLIEFYSPESSANHYLSLFK